MDNFREKTTKLKKRQLFGTTFGDSNVNSEGNPLPGVAIGIKKGGKPLSSTHNSTSPPNEISPSRRRFRHYRKRRRPSWEESIGWREFRGETLKEPPPQERKKGFQEHAGNGIVAYLSRETAAGRVGGTVGGDQGMG
ncbi:hypothetical protein LIER_13014 [Lithospermum erythrorhizon]|uniref:Uncharacterized protein n=1 Tax=Lithospermum erythrorhizon TaxID=34254 RepID=A0AAV3PUA6_LITER